MQDQLQPHHPPEQSLPAAQGVRRRIRFIGPVAVMSAGMAAALPLAGHTYGWKPTFLTAGVVCVMVGAAWLIAQSASRETEQRLGDSDRDRIRGETALRMQLADTNIRLDVLIEEQRTATRLNWRVLHILRQQQRAGRKGRAVPDRDLRHRLDKIERTLGAAAAGAFDPATQQAIRSINRDLTAH